MGRPHRTCLSIALTVAAAASVPGTVAAQAVIHQPVYYKRPANVHALTFTRDMGLAEVPRDSGSWLPNLGLNMQFGQAQLGASGDIYRLDIYGTPQCRPDPAATPTNPKPDVCTPHIVFSPTISSSVVDAVTTSVSALRDYLLSQSGAPLTARVGWVQGDTRRGDVRQSWFAYEGSASLRALPVTGTSGHFQTAGALTASATFQANLDFDVAKIDHDGATVYPGSAYVSVSPTAALPIGGDVRAAIFAGAHPTTLVLGLDYRVGFQLKGPKPWSFSAVGTWGTVGFKAAQSSLGLAVSKVVGQ